MTFTKKLFNGLMITSWIVLSILICTNKISFTSYLGVIGITTSVLFGAYTRNKNKYLTFEIDALVTSNNNIFNTNLDLIIDNKKKDDVILELQTKIEEVEKKTKPKRKYTKRAKKTS